MVGGLVGGASVGVSLSTGCLEDKLCSSEGLDLPVEEISFANDLSNCFCTAVLAQLSMVACNLGSTSRSTSYDTSLCMDAFKEHNSFLTVA